MSIVQSGVSSIEKIADEIYGNNRRSRHLVMVALAASGLSYPNQNVRVDLDLLSQSLPRGQEDLDRIRAALSDERRIENPTAKRMWRMLRSTTGISDEEKHEVIETRRKFLISSDRRSINSAVRGRPHRRRCDVGKDQRRVASMIRHEKSAYLKQWIREWPDKLDKEGELHKLKQKLGAVFHTRCVQRRLTFL